MVEVDGVLYSINTDFRVGMTYSNLIMAGRATVQQVLNLWFPSGVPQNVDAALEAINAFFRCGKEPVSEGSSQDAPPYSYEADTDVLIAAFQREYGIDLTAAKMHWWRFSALRDGLLMHSFTERVGYRVCDLSKIKDKKLQSQYRELKSKYALNADGTQYRAPQTLEEYNELLLRQARGET